MRGNLSTFVRARRPGLRRQSHRSKGGAFGRLCLFRHPGNETDSEWSDALRVFQGRLVVVTPALLQAGVNMAIRGVRLLRGENPSFGWGYDSLSRGASFCFRNCFRLSNRTTGPGATCER